jgi:hypothetical protein
VWAAVRTEHTVGDIETAGVTMTLLNLIRYSITITHTYLLAKMAANDNYNGVITAYLSELNDGHRVYTSVVQTWWGNCTLNCITLDPTNLPKHFRIKTPDWKNKDHTQIEYQYDLRTLKLGRPKAYRIPFLNTEEYFSEDKYTVSHLCHNGWCLNPKHHVLENLADNKGRNGCPGGTACRHRVSCLIPGRYYAGDSSVAPNHLLVSAFKV